MINTLVCLCAFAAFLSFAWGVRNHFSHGPDGLPPAMRRLSVLSAAAMAVFVVHLYYRRAAVLTLDIISVALSVGSMALFWWTVRITRTDPPAVAHQSTVLTVVHSRGPYRLVRHPFYLSYCLFWFGTGLAGGPIQWPFVVTLIGWYYLTARNEERLYTQSGIAPVYEQYKRRTGMLLPRILKRTNQ